MFRYSLIGLFLLSLGWAQRPSAELAKLHLQQGDTLILVPKGNTTTDSCAISVAAELGFHFKESIAIRSRADRMALNAYNMIVREALGRRNGADWNEAYNRRTYECRTAD